MGLRQELEGINSELMAATSLGSLERTGDPEVPEGHANIDVFKQYPGLAALHEAIWHVHIPEGYELKYGPDSPDSDEYREGVVIGAYQVLFLLAQYVEVAELEAQS